jgi:hypothetical protein
MAQSRFIEMRLGEDWGTVSDQFAEWVRAHAANEPFGWSEGDVLSLPDGTQMACFRIPDKHSNRFVWFETWAESTDRLYGIAFGSTVQFPRKPQLSVALPSGPQHPIPLWLRGA